MKTPATGIIQPRRIWPALVCVSALVTPTVHGLDWPQFRGPTHDGISPETIRTNWSEQPPQEVWRLGLESGSLAGFSTFTVSQGRAFTLVRRFIGGENRELCLALDAGTRQELWATDVGSGSYNSTGIPGADGPRSTPVVDGNRVYVLSAYLSLSCLDAANGGIIWSNDVRFGGGVLTWQNGASPLIEGDLILLNCRATESMMAVRKTDGGEVWRRHSYRMTYANPIAATLQGVRQILFYTASGLVSVVPETGDILWRYSTDDGCPYASTATAASPVVAGDIVYCSAGYGVGAGAVRVAKTGGTFTAAPLWRKAHELENHWSTPVHHNGYLYGIYGTYNDGVGVLKCVDPATGNEMWSRSENLRSGGILLVGEQLLLLNEAGQLVLVAPSPARYTELARVTVLGGKSWNAPAISNGRIYARSTTEAVCVDVSAPIPPPPLELSPSVVSATGPFRLRIGNEDGSPLDSGRVPGIHVLAATDLSTGTNGWTPFTNAAVLIDGALQVDDPESVSRPQRFFKVLEQR